MDHVLVDFENVQEIDASAFGSWPVSFTLLLGARQKKVDARMMEQLLRVGANVQVVCLESSGRNALDFTLAYYLGRAAIADPAAYFHIVSKDKGYDPLIAHLKSRHVRAYRHDDFKSVRLSHPQKTQSLPADPLLASALAHLKRNASNRPRRRSTLTRNLQNALGNDSSETDIASLIDRLLKAGHLSIDDKGRVTYAL